jgi:N-methylhydantoinase A/oxoprolinase/acetone carboxylase beta subunit
MVESMDAFTQGIGGDSWIRADKPGNLQIGPRRVLPLCALGHRYPVIIEAMKNFGNQKLDTALPLFLLKQKSLAASQDLPEACREIFNRVDENPLFVPPVVAAGKYPSIDAQSITYLIDKGLVGACSVTPTDAVNVLGQYQTGSSEAARMGAEIMAAGIGMNVEEFCKMAVAQVQYEIVSAMVRCALRGEEEKISEHTADSFFIRRALKKTSPHLINCSICLSCPVVAVGAPSATYLPDAISLLGCDLHIPENAAVANAIGAVTGVISQTAHILIKTVCGGASFRVHTPEGIHDFEKFKDAESYAVKTAAEIAGNRARESGAVTVDVGIVKKNIGAKTGKPGDESEILVETEIIATAVGRPRMGA